jgi:hypothetical protein
MAFEGQTGSDRVACGHSRAWKIDSEWIKIGFKLKRADDI